MVERYAFEDRWRWPVLRPIRSRGARTLVNVEPLDAPIVGLEDVTERDYWPSAANQLVRPPDGDGVAVRLDTARETEADRVEGYQKSSEILVRSMLAQPAWCDVLIYPFAHNWRHHFELRLKWLLRVLRELHGQPATKIIGHRLAPLWSEVKALIAPLDYCIDSSDVVHAERLILELDRLDPDGQNFRYHRRSDESIALDGIQPFDLRSFHDALSAAASFLLSLLEVVYIEIEGRQEEATDVEPGA